MRVLAFLFIFNLISVHGQIELELPDLEGELGTFVCPEGWMIEEGTPDIIADDGTYPDEDSSYDIQNINGDGLQGNSMVLLYFNTLSFNEGIKTYFTDLEIGQSYSISLQWQNITMICKEPEAIIQGGHLLAKIQNEEYQFYSSGNPNDEWQRATINFTAKSKTVELVLKCGGPLGKFFGKSYSGGIVIDNVCKACRAAGAY